MRPINISSVTAGGILKVSVALVLFALIAWYGTHQARLLLGGPQVTIDAPSATTHTDRIITVAGTAQNITEIRLNGRSIDTSEDGRFSERLVLESGYTIMTITAADRYGRETTLTRSFVYTPST